MPEKKELWQEKKIHFYEKLSTWTCLYDIFFVPFFTHIIWKIWYGSNVIVVVKRYISCYFKRHTKFFYYILNLKKWQKMQFYWLEEHSPTYTHTHAIPYVPLLTLISLTATFCQLLFFYSWKKVRKKYSTEWETEREWEWEKVDSR